MTIKFKIITHLNEEQRDALAEIVNIAMGQAGDSLARLLDTFVQLSIPRVRLMAATQINEVLAEMIGENAIVSAVRQPFYNHLHGEAIVVYNDHGCNDLGDLMGYDGALDTQEETELLLDVGNILAGASLNGVAEQLSVEITFSAPSVLARRVPLEELLRPEEVSWSHALLIEVNFALESRDFRSHLLIMLTEDSINVLRKDIDSFMEAC